jgi:hypothetical protein
MDDPQFPFDLTQVKFFSKNKFCLHCLHNIEPPLPPLPLPTQPCHCGGTLSYLSLGCMEEVVGALSCKNFEQWKEGRLCVVLLLLIK